MLARRCVLPFLLFSSLACADGNIAGFEWHLRHGDDPGWIDAPLADAAWQPINVGISWERQNHGNGDAWLRTETPVPADLRETGLRLEMNLRAARAEAYVNGHKLAETSEASPVVAVDVPSDLIRWGAVNQLAVRVLGHPWTGGLGNDRIELVPRASRGERLAVRTAMPPADHVFGADQEVACDVTVTGAGGAEPVQVATRIVSDFHEKLFTDQRQLAAGARTLPLRFPAGTFRPGFYQVVVQATQGSCQAQQVLWFAVEPTRITCEVNPEPDLDEYWARAKAELAAVPANVRVARAPDKCTARHEVFSVEMDSVEGVTLRAWYIVPARRTGPLPAALVAPGYSAAMQPEWFQDDDDLIYLALDTRGHGRSRDTINPGFGTPGLVGYRVLEPEHYIYKGSYLDCGRALEFLASRPEVDPRRVAVVGGSQSGGFAFAAAALFPERVACCVAGMPFLGDFRDHQRIRDVYRVEMESYLKPGEPSGWQTVLRTMNLVDTACLAERITCPVLMGTGLFDDDCPSHIGFAVFNRIRAPKEFRVYPESAHLVGPRWEADSRAWLRQQFGLPVAPSSRRS